MARSPKEESTPNDEPIVVRVFDLAPGGDGLGRLPDGRVALIRGALPGDTVEIRIEKDKASHVMASVRDLVRPSEARVPAPCMVVDRCGGCPLMKLSTEAQLRAKESMLHQSLARIGRLNDDELKRVRPLLPAARTLGYRNRLRLQHRAGQLGFFRDKTQELVPVERCEIASPAVNQLLREVRARLSETVSSLVGLELRVLPKGPGESEPERSVTLLVRDGSGSIRETKRVSDALSEIATVRTLAPRSAGPLPSHKSLQKLWLEPDLFILLAPGAFNQVNLDENERLIRIVVETAREIGARTFLDLYGGAGNFTMPLLKRGLKGTLIEVQEESVRSARRAAETQEFTGGEFIAGNVPEVARELLEAKKRADLVILDPPRRGALPALDVALQLAKKTIVLVSCDPPTLARDLRFLLDRGATLVDVTPLDMFPHTHHLEAAARLDVSGADRRALGSLE